MAQGHKLGYMTGRELTKNFKYLGSVVTENRKYETEIQRSIGLAKEAFHKQGSEKREIVRNKEKSRSLLCDIHSFIWHWTLDNCPQNEENSKQQNCGSTKHTDKSMNRAKDRTS